MKGAKPSSAEMRALRDQKLHRVTDPAEEARRRERLILQHFTSAREDFDWIAANEGWTLLGFATMADWWAERIQPVASALALRPAPDMARKVIDIILDEQATLPTAQQRSKREIAKLVGVHRDTVSGRKRQDRPSAEPPHEGDLDDAQRPTDVDATAATAAFDKKYSPQAPPAAESSVDQVALVAPQQPGLDSSTGASEASPPVEAPAGQPPQSDAAEAAPPSIDRPGIEPPIAVGEARADVGLLVAGGTPSADAGEQTAGDEVEDGDVIPPTDLSSADPASAFMDAWREHIRLVLRVDVDVVGPMLTDAEFTELYGDLELLRERVKKLQRAGREQS